MICTTCGKEIESASKFCAFCGTAITLPSPPPPPNHPPTSSNPYAPPTSLAQAPETPQPQSFRGISWGMLAINFLGMLALAYVSYPDAFASELRGPSAPIYLGIRVAVPVVFAAVATGVFNVFRRKTEGKSIKRSFVIVSWVFLCLVILGERGS